VRGGQRGRADQQDPNHSSWLCFTQNLWPVSRHQTAYRQCLHVHTYTPVHDRHHTLGTIHKRMLHVPFSAVPLCTACSLRPRMGSTALSLRGTQTSWYVDAQAAAHHTHNNDGCLRILGLQNKRLCLLPSRSPAWVALICCPPTSQVQCFQPFNGETPHSVLSKVLPRV
jgi:hypothetical protein